MFTTDFWAFGFKNARVVDTWRTPYQTLQRGGQAVSRESGSQNRWRWTDCGITCLLLLSGLAALFLSSALLAHAREKDALQYGEGLIVNIETPVADVTKAVEEVLASGLIRGTKEYNKDDYVSGAEVVSSTPAFSAWTESGKAYYKVRKQALDPRNFKDGGDVGTLAVRYVVDAQGTTNTVLRIDAVFMEDFRHAIHPSNGSVESSEYKDIQDHIAAIELLKKETADAEQAKRERNAQRGFGLGENTELLSSPPAGLVESSSRTENSLPSSFPRGGAEASADPNESPEQHLARLRHYVERLVKKPGAPLKTAPFHSASILKSLEPGTQVLVVILTPYWFGVETGDGQHGWIRRDQLEPLP